MRVLVVDDSPAVRVRLVAMLRELDTVGTVEEAGDGDEALAAIAARVPDVVILDLHMPGKNGLAILPTIKGAAGSPLVVVLTNHPTDDYRRTCIGLGADFFFDKSKSFDGVLALLVAPAEVRKARAASTSGKR